MILDGVPVIVNDYLIGTVEGNIWHPVRLDGEIIEMHVTRPRARRTISYTRWHIMMMQALNPHVFNNAIENIRSRQPPSNRSQRNW